MYDLFIERYYYSKRPDTLNGDLSYFKAPGGFGELTPEEQQQIDVCFQKLLDLAGQDPCYNRIIYPERITAFRELIAPSIMAARDMGSNVVLYVEDWSGAIFFLRRHMNILDPAKKTLALLTEQASDYLVTISEKVGTNDASDFDGWPVLNFWFDFFEYKEGMEYL